jgi:hypothetical protein
MISKKLLLRLAHEFAVMKTVMKTCCFAVTPVLYNPADNLQVRFVEGP